MGNSSLQIKRFLRERERERERESEKREREWVRPW
jgi:hypothetical protein